MFGTKRGMYRHDNSLQHVKNVHIPIVFTSDGHIDKLYLETYCEKCESRFTYEKWLALKNVCFYAQLEQLAILEPKVYRQALSSKKPGLLEGGVLAALSRHSEFLKKLKNLNLDKN
jgi:hypothetical protein